MYNTTVFKDNHSTSYSLLDGKTIGIAGFGHLGSSIAQALAKNGFPKERLLISCGGSAASIDRIKKANFIDCMTDTQTLMLQSDIIILAARPQSLPAFRSLKIKKDAFIMSFMAGVSIETLLSVCSSTLCRVMCSGPETLLDGSGIAVTFPSEALPRTLLEVAGLKVFDVSCESELDSFTVGICIPPILMNIDIDEAEKIGALMQLAKRYPIYIELAPWIDKIVMQNSDEKKASTLANVSTKGGVTEAMTTAIANGASFADAIAAGLRRNDELCEKVMNDLKNS